MSTQASIAMTLVANTRHFNSQLRKSKQRVASLGRSAKTTGRSLGIMGRMGARAVSAFAGFAGIAAVVQGLRSLVKTTEDFNQAMLSSLAIMGDVTKTLKGDMVRAALSSAATTKFATKDTAASYFFLASAGLDAKQSIAALPLVAKFAQAGMFDMKLATDLLTDAQSALGLTVKGATANLKNMSHVADVLVKANTLANASVQQFSEALTTKAAAAMKFLNIRIEEGVAVLAAFADQGLKSAAAGTAFNIVTRDLTTKAIKNAKAFEELGIRVFDSTGRLNNMARIIGDVERALAGMNAEQAKATLLSLGFADKSSIFIQTLLGMSSKIREYERALSQAGGITDTIANKQLTNLAKATAHLQSRWTQLANTFDLANIWAKGVGVVAKSVAGLNMMLTGTGKSMAVVGENTKWLNRQLKDTYQVVIRSANATGTLSKRLQEAAVSAKELAAQQKAIEEALTLKRGATENFQAFFDDLKRAVAEFDLSPIEQEINQLVRNMKAAGVDVIPKALIARAGRLAQAFERLNKEADAFATLKDQALGLVRATRTTNEEYKEQLKLLHKLATTIDPATGKALIDTDTLNRGLAKAKKLMRDIRNESRGFLSGKREFVSRMNTVTLANLGSGGGDSAGTATMAQTLLRIENLLRKTRVN